jgi:hypothetical protein
MRQKSLYPKSSPPCLPHKIRLKMSHLSLLKLYKTIIAGGQREFVFEQKLKSKKKNSKK